jgi:hypothetical protein
MDELETRLRSALATMAEEVPPARDAWAEHMRRVAAKSRRDRRRPALMAAAAAAVVTLIAVPTLVVGGWGTTRIGSGSAPPSDDPNEASVLSKVPNRQPTYKPRPGERTVTEPFGLSSDSQGQTYVYTFQVASQLQLCVVEQGRDVPDVIDGTVVKADCRPVPRPAAGKVFWTVRGVPLSGDATGWVYVASLPTAKIAIKPAGGGLLQYAPLRTGNGEFGVFGVVLGSTKAPTNLTAVGPNGEQLENR